MEIPADQMHTQADVDVLFVHETGICARGIRQYLKQASVTTGPALCEQVFSKLFRKQKSVTLDASPSP